VGREPQDAGHTARSCFVWPRHLQRVTYLWLMAGHPRRLLVSLRATNLKGRTPNVPKDPPFFKLFDLLSTHCIYINRQCINILSGRARMAPATRR
jgi:hypothetical protein